MLAAPLLTDLQGEILGYYPLNETSGTTIPNVAGTAPDGVLNTGGIWLTDPTRGQVLYFDGIDGYADLGATTIPAINGSGSFTWSFWSFSEANTLNSIILGNRYDSNGNEFPGVEFMKFTPQQFEFYKGGAQEGINYSDLTLNTWNHHVMVQSGSTLTYFRDGHFAGRRTFSIQMQNPMPLYLGGSRTDESWTGRIDDVAIWNNAIPLASIAKIAGGTATPSAVSSAAGVMTPVMSENFSAPLSLWNVTNRGLENSGDGGYAAPDLTDGKLTLSGTANNQYWFGRSIETIATFDSTKETRISVDRLSLSGSGSAFRSSLWVIGESGDVHFLHFSQNVNEGGWSFNARDDSGTGTNNPFGTGVNIASLDGQDTNTGAVNMGIHIVPMGPAGDVWMYMLLNGEVYADQRFSNFPSTFRVALTGQARATGDFVSASYDNFLVEQVPEPSSALLVALGLSVATGIRRRHWQ